MNALLKMITREVIVPWALSAAAAFAAKKLVPKAKKEAPAS
ncbi:hypothetical protein [Sphingomonas sp. Ag1]|nr:hypothetical protein [Sphingomonas sp. Ag1]